MLATLQTEALRAPQTAAEANVDVQQKRDDAGHKKVHRCIAPLTRARTGIRRADELPRVSQALKQREDALEASRREAEDASKLRAELAAAAARADAAVKGKARAEELLAQARAASDVVLT